LATLDSKAQDFTKQYSVGIRSTASLILN